MMRTLRSAFEHALSLDPQFLFAWNGKSHALHNLNRYEEALAASEQAITLDVTYALAWSAKGNALSRLKRYDEALAAYERRLALGISRIGLKNKAHTLRNLGRIQEAEAVEAEAKRLSS